MGAGVDIGVGDGDRYRGGGWGVGGGGRYRGGGGWG